MARNYWRPLALATLGLACALALAACGGSSEERPGPPPEVIVQTAGTADLFLSPAGADTGICHEGAPCRTLQWAYRVAEPGQVVELEDGSYPGGRIERDSGKPSSDQVVFRPAAGARAVIGEELEIQARGLELRELHMPGGWRATPGSADLTMRDLVSKHFFIYGAQRVSVIGGSVGPGVDYHPIIAADQGQEPREILVDGVDFHDWTRSNDTIHTECLQIGAGDGITIRNSSFRNCHVMDVFVAHWGDTPYTRNVTIEGNVLAAPSDGADYSMQIGDWENTVVRGNTARKEFIILDLAGDGPVQVSGNRAPLHPWQCVEGVRYASNVWSAAQCDPSDSISPDAGADPQG